MARLDPPEDNYPDGVLMIFAGRHPERTKRALEAARGWMYDQLEHGDLYGPEETVEDIQLLDELIRQIDD